MAAILVINKPFQSFLKLNCQAIAHFNCCDVKVWLKDMLKAVILEEIIAYICLTCSSSSHLAGYLLHSVGHLKLGIMKMLQVCIREDKENEMYVWKRRDKWSWWTKVLKETRELHRHDIDPLNDLSNLLPFLYFCPAYLSRSLHIFCPHKRMLFIEHSVCWTLSSCTISPIHSGRPNSSFYDQQNIKIRLISLWMFCLLFFSFQAPLSPFY